MKQRSYKATGINLKAMPMGEADRLITVLTKEHGLVRAIAPGARKHKSRLAGRSGLFVVNDLLFSSGKSLDKMIQAETLMSFSGLSKDLAKLTASQYLAEIALAQALSGQPQEDLYCLLIEHLSRLETATKPNILPCLAQATFHLLALAGVAPDVFRCCLSRSLLTAQLGDPDWRVGFSVSSGGAIDLAEVSRLEQERLSEIEPIEREWQAQRGDRQLSDSQWQTGLRSKVAKEVTRNLGIVGYLSAAELALMQQLSKPELIMASSALPSASQLASPFGSQSGTIKTGATQESVEITLNSVIANSVIEESGSHYCPHYLWWRHIEQFLRQYAQYQFDRPIKSAALIDTCFTSPSHAARV